MNFDSNGIRAFIQKAKDLNLTGLRVAEGESELSIDLPHRGTVVSAPHAPAISEAALHDVVSRLVGYFRPSVDIGARVENGAAIGAIESLGLQNDVPAPSSGCVTEFFAEDGDAVEYGTLIARIKP